MKTALLLCGQIRNAAEFHSSINSFLIQQYNADVFISTWTPNSKIKSAVGYELKNDTSVDKLIQLYSPKQICLEDFTNLPIKSEIQNYQLTNKTSYDGTYIEETIIENVFFQYYKRKKGFELIKNYETYNKLTYDCIIVSRFDLCFLSFPIIEPEYNKIYIPIGPNQDSEMYHYGGIRDLCAVGDYRSISVYCGLYDMLKTYHDSGHGLHPESILRKHLEFNHLTIERFPIHSKLREKNIL